ncbi:hypothetical protein KCP75_13430 [Salmonella enterica subsp. enterica]|nr:hypothetical protein KCP75_13430 [Salmonella enterica subsp. enterica]
MCSLPGRWKDLRWGLLCFDRHRTRRAVLSGRVDEDRNRITTHLSRGRGGDELALRDEGATRGVVRNQKPLLRPGLNCVPGHGQPWEVTAAERIVTAGHRERRSAGRAAFNGR